MAVLPTPGYEGRIILGAAGEDLHHALDFIFPADDRVKLGMACQLRQITPELIMGGRLALLCCTGSWSRLKIFSLVSTKRTPRC